MKDTLIEMPPLESNQARLGIVAAYKALRVLDEGGLLDFITEYGGDPKSAEQARDAIEALERGMSPNLLVTVLPAYTKVRFATDRSREGEYMEGQIREGAWGLFPDRGEQATERRITTTNGFEFFANRETVFTYFVILERPEVRR